VGDYSGAGVFHCGVGTAGFTRFSETCIVLILI
jgi:hypothetical protein